MNWGLVWSRHRSGSGQPGPLSPITDLPVTGYRLPITDYRLPITDSPVTDSPITDYRLLVTGYRRPNLELSIFNPDSLILWYLVLSDGFFEKLPIWAGWSH